MNKTHNIYQLIAGSFRTAPLSLALTVLALNKGRADGIVALLQHATGVASAHVFMAIPSGVFCLALGAGGGGDAASFHQPATGGRGI